MCWSRPHPCTSIEWLVTTLKNERQQEKIAENEDLVPKRKAMSVIWNYFGYKKDDTDQTLDLCRQCLASVATMRGNTTNLFDHLRRYHTAQCDKKRSDQCRLIVHKTAAVQHDIKCYSGHLMKIPVFFPITIYITGLKKIAMSFFFSNIVQP